MSASRWLAAGARALRRQPWLTAARPTRTSVLRSKPPHLSFALSPSIPLDLPTPHRQQWPARALWPASRRSFAKDGRLPSKRWVAPAYMLIASLIDVARSPPSPPKPRPPSKRYAPHATDRPTSMLTTPPRPRRPSRRRPSSAPRAPRRPSPPSARYASPPSPHPAPADPPQATSARRETAYLALLVRAQHHPEVLSIRHSLRLAAASGVLARNVSTGLVLCGWARG